MFLHRSIDIIIELIFRSLINSIVHLHHRQKHSLYQWPTGRYIIFFLHLLSTTTFGRKVSVWRKNGRIEGPHVVIPVPEAKFCFVISSSAKERLLLLRKYSYSGRRSSADPLRNTPWKRSVSTSSSSLRLERELRAVSVNCYVQTSPVVHWCSRPPPCAASLLVSSDTSRASDNTERGTEGWRREGGVFHGNSAMVFDEKNRICTLGLAGT